MQRPFSILLLVATALISVQGFLNEDLPLRHTAGEKIPQVSALSKRRDFDTQATRPSKFQSLNTCAPNVSHAYICFDGRPEAFVTTDETNMLVLRMEFEDLRFTQADRTFNYQNWYITQESDGSRGVLGAYLNDNSRGQFAVKLVDVEVTLYTSRFNHSELLAAVAAELANNPGPTYDEKQLYFNAVANEVVRQYLYVSGQSVSVYDIWAIHIPEGPFDMATVGKGLGISGSTGVAWRDTTQAWGNIIGMQTGCFLRLPPGGNSTSEWGAIAEGEGMSGMGNSNDTAVDLPGHWPAREKLRVGWYTMGVEVLQVTATTQQRIYAHNNYQRGTAIANRPTDGYFSLQIGSYTNTWWVSYYDYQNLATGATLNLDTTSVNCPTILVSGNPALDGCPNCPSGYNCPWCDNMYDTTVKEGHTFDAGYFTIETLYSGSDSDGNPYIDVQINMSSTQLCPLPDHYGADCEKECWGGVHKCGGPGHGMCSSGPTGSGECTCDSTAWVGAGCDEDDFCDADMQARKNPLIGLESFITANTRTELAADFLNTGRTGNIGKVTVSGNFMGIGVHTPAMVELALYKGNATFQLGSGYQNYPIELMLRANVTNGVDGDIMVHTPPFFDSLDLEVALHPSHPLAQIELMPGTYFLSVMPYVPVGAKWLTDSLASDLEANSPDVQSVNGGMWQAPTNAYTKAPVTTSGRMQVDITKSTCKEYFAPFPDMNTLIIRMQYPDLLMATADVNADYNGTFGYNGTFANHLFQSSQGMASLASHLDYDIKTWFLTPVFMSTKNFTDLIDDTRINDPTYRSTLFHALRVDALYTVRLAGYDPDFYDVHFGFYPAFGDNTNLQRTFPTTKGIWTVAPSTAPLNSLITAFGFVLGLETSWFMRPIINQREQDLIRIPNGASIDGMGWSWNSPNFLGSSALVDWNVHDKVKLGWISDDRGLLSLNRTEGKITFNLYAHNAATPGVYKAVSITEGGVSHGWWLQYYDAGPTVINQGVSVIFETNDGQNIFVDATEGTDNCPGCLTGVEDACRICNMRDTTIVPGARLELGYIAIDVGAVGNDNFGNFLPVTITFSAVERCPLIGHYGAGCHLQCPGGAMDTCNDQAQCSTGTMGTGACGCAVGMGAACELVNDCGKSYGAMPLQLQTSMDKLLYAFSDREPYTKSVGPVADFETVRPAHLKGITFWGRAAMSWTGTDIYKPRRPRVIKVIIYYNDEATNTPGAIRDIKYVNRHEFIEMEAGQQFMSTVTKLRVSFDPNQDVNRFTLWPGKYWVQVLVEDDILWEIVMEDAGTVGNFPDMFMDEYNTLGLGFNETWHPTTAVAAMIPSLASSSSLELKFVLDFDHCLPSYQYLGIPLPKPDVTTYDYIDFFPKVAIEGETLNITFRGYIPYGCGQTAHVKISNTRAGYGCYGEAPGGSARPLTPNKQVTFTVSQPGVYSVCIKTEHDLDWEEIGREDLVVYEFQSIENFYGFSSCQALMGYNTSVCGCIYDQPGPSQVPMVLPVDFPYSYMTAGATPIMVRQGCCTFITDKVETFAFVDENRNPTANEWKVCLNNPE